MDFLGYGISLKKIKKNKEINLSGQHIPFTARSINIIDELLNCGKFVVWSENINIQLNQIFINRNMDINFINIAQIPIIGLKYLRCI